MPSLISVIIPVYNHAHTLERSLLSITAQTLQPLEVIIVNDGSTDNFNEVIKSTLEKVRGLNTKVIQQTNQGAGAARNHGFRESKGDYVIFWDADTVAEPTMLEDMQRALTQHPEASYAYSQFKFGWKTMKSQEFNSSDLQRYNYIDTPSLIRLEALQTPPLAPPLIEEGTFNDGDFVAPVSSPYKGEDRGGGFVAGPFDESLRRFQDWDLWLTLLEEGKTGVFVPKVLYKKIVRGRKGYSFWLPGFMYHLPWKIKTIRAYEEAKRIIVQKHSLTE
ncbi:MAG: glycosyltransferase [Candidatus Magasanikbacteria bacterium]|nr:glycosyltransferase [Candidatus Magasanikbacteria bacterium]